MYYDSVREEVCIDSVLIGMVCVEWHGVWCMLTVGAGGSSTSQ